MPRRWASPNATNANSPPWARTTPAWRACEIESLKASARAVIMLALTTMTPDTIAIILGNWETRRPMSMENPTVMKKRPSRRPRNGTMSASTWYRYLVSDRSTPARKAPSVLESPRPSVKIDIPVTVSRMSDRKASCDLDRATTKKILFRINRPMKAIVDSAIEALTMDDESACTKFCPPPARSGMPTSIGTIARSWKSSIPNAARPWRVLSSSLSRRSCSTNADDERASPPPITTLAGPATLGKTSGARAAKTSVVTTICAVPNPKTSFLIDTRRSRLSSSPISKRKKTIPSSARASIVCRSLTAPRPDGPSTHPDSRKPKMGLMSSILKTGITHAVAISSTSTSLFAPVHAPSVVGTCGGGTMRA
mmetsp:Transcript_37280/g.100900  ORF Transcript_37280/g.100900 Transcript_37280/m.100900 type:complete len:367 (+) Transcript_37280:1111-2211(+)